MEDHLKRCWPNIWELNQSYHGWDSEFYETEKCFWDVKSEIYFCLVWDDECLVFLRNTQINDKTIWNGQIICFRSSEDKNHKFFGVKKIPAANNRNCIEICNENK